MIDWKVRTVMIASEEDRSTPSQMMRNEEVK